MLATTVSPSQVTLKSVLKGWLVGELNPPTLHPKVKRCKTLRTAVVQYRHIEPRLALYFQKLHQCRLLKRAFQYTPSSVRVEGSKIHFSEWSHSHLQSVMDFQAINFFWILELSTLEVLSYCFAAGGYFSSTNRRDPVWCRLVHSHVSESHNSHSTLMFLIVPLSETLSSTIQTIWENSLPIAV